MIQFDTKLIDIIQRTPDVKSFRFEIDKRIDFKPGQFFFVTIKIDHSEETKHFSFSNSPTEKGYVECTKKITKSIFSQAINRLKVGDWTRLKMPYGSFTPPFFTKKKYSETERAEFTFEGEYEKIAFLSGGIGITPIRSICKFATDMKLTTDIILLYGNKGVKDIIFRPDFDDMQKFNKNLHIVYTLTSPEVDLKRWQGRRGLIDDRMIKEEVDDYKDRIFYICGPPRMVESLVNILKDKLIIRENKIRIENFPGY